MPQTKERKIERKTYRKQRQGKDWMPMVPEFKVVFKEVFTKSKAGVEYSKFKEELQHNDSI